MQNTPALKATSRADYSILPEGTKPAVTKTINEVSGWLLRRCPPEIRGTAMRYTGPFRPDYSRCCQATGSLLRPNGPVSCHALRTSGEIAVSMITTNTLAGHQRHSRLPGYRLSERPAVYQNLYWFPGELRLLFSGDFPESDEMPRLSGIASTTNRARSHSGLTIQCLQFGVNRPTFVLGLRLIANWRSLLETRGLRAMKSICVPTRDMPVQHHRTPVSHVTCWCKTDSTASHSDLQDYQTLVALLDAGLAGGTHRRESMKYMRRHTRQRLTFELAGGNTAKHLAGSCSFRFSQAA